jgi:hypothetical protein
MAGGTVVDFNRLPRPTRERIMDSLGPKPRLAPLFADPGTPEMPLLWWMVSGLCCLSILLGTALSDFGQLGPATDAVQHAGVLPLYFGSIFFLTAVGLGAAVYLEQRTALPFPPGRYLFPHEFIDARSRHLRILPLSELEDFKAVHEETSGVYSHTTFTFFFENGEREQFVIRGTDAAEQRLRDLESRRAAFWNAPEGKEPDAPPPDSLFFDSATTGHEGGPLVGELPRVLERRWLSALVVGMVLGTSIWLVRNLLSDHTAFTSAKRMGLDSTFRDYLRTGRLHVDEAKVLGEKAGFSECEHANTERCWRDFLVNWSESPRLQEVRAERMPRAALDDASSSISALRQFREKYPHSVVDAEAGERLHQLFARSFTDFQKQASTKTPGLVPFVGKLLAHLEATGNPKVLVRFRRKASSSLLEADKHLEKAGKKEGGSFASVSPSFTDTKLLPLENHIVEGMGVAFKQIFPTDLLVLEKGPALSAGQDPSGGSVPTLGVLYTVRWSGATYSSLTGQRRFVGIVFEFDVDMRLSNEKPLHFSFTVEPPALFTTESNNPTIEDVYNTMALRAFDELDDKLRSAFFRPDSKAFMAGTGVP